MHNVSLRRASGEGRSAGRLILEGQVKTYRYIDEQEAADIQAAQSQQGGAR